MLRCSPFRSPLKNEALIAVGLVASGCDPLLDDIRFVGT